MFIHDIIFSNFEIALEAVQKDEVLNNKLSFCKLTTPPNLPKGEELFPFGDLGGPVDRITFKL